MKWIALIVLVGVLAGCSDPGADIERHMHDAQMRNDAAEACREARRLQDIRESQHREAEYRDAKLTGDIYCAAARPRGY